ncbi:H+/Cl-antiporter ClcA [Actinomyces ruminicola]|uniref:H+/Cl-antiporter ClcA n=2 Tax=Actinomyces ruminicola TaxID=332524 RepID=A0A1G9XTY9_9ACTO|nr:H+/Cl-antiporter ClcA [Actinomyces ruminicola]
MTSSPAPSLPAARIRARLRLGAAVVLSGMAAGLIGIAMAILLEGFEWLFYGVSEGTLPQRVQAAAPWRRVLAPAVGGLLAGALWWWERATGGVVGVEAAVGDVSAHASRRMGLLRPFGDGVLQVLTVGAGNSVGREGAPRLMAGAVAAGLASRLGLEAKTTRMLVAAAAGAGLAAMYNAPLGGAAFAVEITMLSGMRRRGVWLAVPVSLLATVVSWLHSGGQPTFQVTMGTPDTATLVAALPVAGLAALLGVGARSLWRRFKDHRLPDTWALPLGIGAAGLLTGSASLWLPVLPGNGRDALEAALVSPVTAAALASLLGVVVLKPLLTGLTLGAGATGGLLAPSFALGGSAGAAVAVAANLAGWRVSIPVLVLVGAGAVLSITQRAPVFGTVFVWELARGPLWVLALMTVVSVCCWWLTSPLGLDRHIRPRRRGGPASS